MCAFVQRTGFLVLAFLQQGEDDSHFSVLLSAGQFDLLFGPQLTIYSQYRISVKLEKQ